VDFGTGPGRAAHVRKFGFPGFPGGGGGAEGERVTGRSCDSTVGVIWGGFTRRLSGAGAGSDSHATHRPHFGVKSFPSPAFTCRRRDLPRSGGGSRASDSPDGDGGANGACEAYGNRTVTARRREGHGKETV